MDIKEKATRSDLIDRYLRIHEEWKGEELASILYIDLGEVNYLTLQTLGDTATDDEIVSSFNEFMTQTRGCEEQIFRMADDLEEIWFEIFCDDFVTQQKKLLRAVNGCEFYIDDPYFEVLSFDDGWGLRSVTAPTNSKNFVTYQFEYADWLFRFRDYDFLSDETIEALDKLYAEYHL